MQLVLHLLQVLHLADIFWRNLMKIAILIKNNEISSYPADLLIDGEVIKSYNIEFELEINKINILIGKSLPSALIKRLREKGIIFLKVNSFNELEGIDLGVDFMKESKIKRGLGCRSKFKE
jgi:hypothetical protein